MRPVTLRNSTASLRARIRPVHRDAGETVLANFGVQGMLLVTGILAARLLGPVDRGYLALLQLLPLVLSQLGSLGLHSAIAYHIAKEPRSASAVARRVTWFAVPQAAVLLVIHTALLWPLVHGRSSAVVVAGIMSLLLTPAGVFQMEALAILQGQGRFRAFNALRVLRLVVYASGLVMVALLHRGKLEIVMAAWVLANVAATSITVGYVLVEAAKGVTAGERDGPSLRELTRFGVRALFGSISPVETFRADQAIVGLFLSPRVLGLYVAALAFTNLPRFIATGMGLIAYPYVASRRDAVTARRSVWWFFRLTIVPVSLVALLLGLSTPFLLPLAFGEEFTEAKGLVRILLLAAVVASARRILSDGLRGAGFPSLGSLAEGVSWLWLAPLLAILAPLAGAMGVAWALTASYTLSFGYLLLLSGVHGQISMPRAVIQPAARFLRRMRLAGRPWEPNEATPYRQEADPKGASAEHPTDHARPGGPPSPI